MSAESSVDGSTCISSEEEECWSCVKWKSPSNANAAGIPPDVVGNCGSSVYDSTSTRHKGHVGD